MSDLRAEHASREAELWSRFEAAVMRIPRDRWSAAGTLPEWTVNQLLWHVAGWMDECASHLELARRGALGPYEDDDSDTDARNTAFAVEAVAMDADAVWTGLLAARDRVLSLWGALPEVSSEAVAWFASETYDHYREHFEELEAFAGRR